MNPSILSSKYVEQLVDKNQKSVVYRTPDLNQQKNRALRQLQTVCVISFSFMCVEFVGGYLSGSLAIMTDAVHLLSDVVGFLATILAIYISRLQANKSMTFGYHRAEIIGAVFSILVIWVLIVWMLIEGIERCFNPRQIDGTSMLILACCGLFFNLVLMKILEDKVNAKTEEKDPEEGARDSDLSELSLMSDLMKNQTGDNTANTASSPNAPDAEKNLSMKAAQIHILGDTIQSAGVIIGAAAVYFGGEDYFIADPIITIVFTIVVMATTIPIMKESIKVLMEALPDSIDYDNVKFRLQKVSGVVNVHDLHIWSLNPGYVTLSAHITSTNPSKTLFEATKICKKLGIIHSTIQVENFHEKQLYDFEKCEKLH